VGHHDGGHTETTLHCTDLAPQPCANFGIQRRQRLVEQQQAWRGCQSAYQGNALLLAPGQLGRILISMLGQIHQRQKLGNARGNLIARLFLADQTKGDILEDGYIGK
jgi:hypothetical protein